MPLATKSTRECRVFVFVFYLIQCWPFFFFLKLLKCLMNLSHEV